MLCKLGEIFVPPHNRRALSSQVLDSVEAQPQASLQLLHQGLCGVPTNDSDVGGQKTHGGGYFMRSWADVVV